MAPDEYSNFWSYPAKLASEIVIQNKDKYDYIILSDKIDNIEYAYPVYAKVGPDQIIYQNKNSSELSQYKFKKYGNVYIGYIPDGETMKFMESLNNSVLYINSPDIKSYLQNYETISGNDGRIFLIISRKSK